MSKDNVLDAMRALPRTTGADVLATLITRDVQVQVEALPGLGAEERAQVLREALGSDEVRDFLSGRGQEPASPSLHAVFGLGHPANARD